MHEYCQFLICMMMENFASCPAGREMYLYGDPAYPLRIHLQAPFRVGVLTRQIDHFHKWRSIINSFYNIKISLTNLILKSVIQKKFYTETRSVRLI